MTSSEEKKVAQGQVPLKTLFIDLNAMLSPEMDDLSPGRFTRKMA
jgi:hypothetical protein